MDNWAPIPQVAVHPYQLYLLSQLLVQRAYLSSNTKTKQKILSGAAHLSQLQ